MRHLRGALLWKNVSPARTRATGLETCSFPVLVFTFISRIYVATWFIVACSETIRGPDDNVIVGRFAWS